MSDKLDELFEAEDGSFFDKENPVDEDGPGFDDEKGDVPGEQAGVELDINAENRLRDSQGRFI